MKFWGMRGLWTVNEAALIIAAIDPDDCAAEDGRSFEAAQRFSHWEQNKYARIMRDSLIDAVVLGELTPFELWIGRYDSGFNGAEWAEYKADAGYAPARAEILPDKTCLIPKTYGCGAKGTNLCGRLWLTVRMLPHRRPCLCKSNTARLSRATPRRNLKRPAK